MEDTQQDAPRRVQAKYYAAKTQRINAFRDMKFGPQDFLYEDQPWKLVSLEGPPPAQDAKEDPESSASLSETAVDSLLHNVKKTAQFEFKKSSPPRNNNASSRTIPGGDEERSKNANNSDTTVCEDKKEETIPENQDTRSTVFTEGSTVDSVSANEAMKKEWAAKYTVEDYQTANTQPPVYTPAQRLRKYSTERPKIVPLTAFDKELLPKGDNEYETIFDGPWKLDRMPAYTDASIPKGPTPPSPMATYVQEYYGKVFSSNTNNVKNMVRNWNAEKTAPSLPENPEDEEDAKPWSLEKKLAY